ncbi:VWA domain-containing protein [Mesorhizobium sp. M4B.F.Ca.ET.215.01.1.1]|uniref:vWA domain-containing protein n=3 Tax=Mesorhizobium TaxID=68287 RepID=UPI000FCB966F|nr:MULTISPECIES: VWA domain-containing protein [unclassified Mesorhizobium]RVD46237.1 VWA domain-containing protein [Mesorhizobium sp. M4B.F.Ca.ET.019.03.1.1]TGQ10939.1 VWA domain-containing protein [Mesorhizobium sp. M4B.F.Ca.ET.215.01.1.1]TGQ38771.1 VWA domain-containing protein [Mesorhizobium sp. M4B.F.Ca.ET.214.01.1.1]TGQ45054.1 VWA domain-containing protein [Mesorhizobium sp. M00.F.Ca.ET.220.01.1.1]TGQ59869.1 VWA domain-containing protein [Mesorhizobium sp. M4B.F.Ca.ET.211.01.1.1]
MALPLTCLPASSPRERGEESLPRAAAPFLGFARLLRRHAFAIAPEQTTSFMQAVTLLGPRSMSDIREAALATLAPSPDRRIEFEAHFRAHFYADARPSIAGEEDEETRIKDDRGTREEESQDPRQEKGGELSSAREQLSSRDFQRDADGLGAFRRRVASALPARRSFRTIRTRSRGTLDLRRSLSEIVSADGDIPSPQLRRRQTVPRKLLLLIDVSGSMKLHTSDYLKLAHAAVQSADRAEVFTFGTRLTRITSALRIRDRDQALARAAVLVDDWDGGTRMGPTLLAFLSVPRFSAFARGAAVVILSDALERGDHADLETAMRRLSARAFRLSLATPLAGDPRFRPATAALRAILPVLDDLVDGSSLKSLTDFILSLARPAPSAEAIWKRVS